MKQLGPLTYFPSLEVHTVKGGIFINQHKYTKGLISQARLQNTTTVDTTTIDAPLELKVGSLIYLIITQPDISHAVNLVS